MKVNKLVVFNLSFKVEAEYLLDGSLTNENVLEQLQQYGTAEVSDVMPINDKALSFEIKFSVTPEYLLDGAMDDIFSKLNEYGETDVINVSVTTVPQEIPTKRKR